MNNEPCAKFTTRVTPKMTVNPDATRNNDEALAKPLSAWTMTVSNLAAQAGRIFFTSASGGSACAPST